MVTTPKTPPYKRRVAPVERMLNRAGFSVVTLVARVKGKVTDTMLEDAVLKIQQRHTLLRVRLVEDQDHQPWFTTDGVQEIPITVIPRQTKDQWMIVVDENNQIPFDFDTRPPIRFILIQGPDVSEVVIFCHHIICDGLSLAYLARDLMMHLGDPGLEVEVLSDPPPITAENLPNDVSLNRVVKFLIKRINKKWDKDKIYFDPTDYQTLNEAYWNHFHHKMLTIELTEDQTSAVVAKCRAEQVTVNSALTMAFVRAQQLVQGTKPFHESIGIAGNLRTRLSPPVGEGMGMYAGAVILDYKYSQDVDFWENTRRLHKKVTPLYGNKTLFDDALMYIHLNPGIMEARHFKVLGGLVSPDASAYPKISQYAQQEDIVYRLLKRNNAESIKKLAVGTAITNLTRLDFPRQYGSLELERLIMNPGGAFPLAMVNLVVGVVTCSGKMSILLEFAEETISTEVVAQIKDTAMDLLL